MGTTRSGTTRTGLLAALALLCALAAAGCRQKPSSVSPDELAGALRAHGVAYDVAETAALPRVDAQGLRLTGDGLEMELYRFGEERDLKLAARAAQMAQAAGPVQAIVRGRFLVVVRKEPNPGQVAAALAKALPEQDR